VATHAVTTPRGSETVSALCTKRCICYGYDSETKSIRSIGPLVLVFGRHNIIFGIGIGLLVLVLVLVYV
jgi:hypothetical protein